MEPEGSVPRLEVPTSSPYPEPDQSNPQKYFTNYRMRLNTFF